MGLLISVGCLSFFIIVLGIILTRLARWYMSSIKIDSEAVALLKQSRAIEQMSTKEQRLHAMVEWKGERDALLRSSENLKRLVELEQAD